MNERIDDSSPAPCSPVWCRVGAFDVCTWPGDGAQERAEQQLRGWERMGCQPCESVRVSVPVLKDIRLRSETLQGEGYGTHGGTATRAAEDVRLLLVEIGRLMSEACCGECNQVDCVCDSV